MRPPTKAVPPPVASPFALLPHLSGTDVARLRAAFVARAMAPSTRRASHGRRVAPHR